MTRAEELAKEIVESFLSKPERLPPSPDSATWDTSGVGSITAEELAQRIAGAIRTYGEEVRRRAAQECRYLHMPFKRPIRHEGEGFLSACDESEKDGFVEAKRFAANVIEKMDLP